MLVTQTSNGVFFVGQILEENNQYTYKRLESKVSLNDSNSSEDETSMEASMQIELDEENLEFFIRSSDKEDYYQLPNNKPYFIKLVSNDILKNNVVKSLENIYTS
ncbi:hypothetical protein [Alteribacillus sp. HJP-4]|uniref:hypothetical protein n=1 Tax=Alteribacillus sp. HJP-4 TaxID=2775394 RepID=UPI0035CCD607